MDHVIGFATRGVSKGIATASEVIAARRNKGEDSSQQASNDRRRSSLQSDSDEDATAREWELDDAGEDEPPSYGTTVATALPASAEEIFQNFSRNHATAINPTFSHSPLPQPVILPQRRPRDRKRGFIRAYAPTLGECSGIDQNTFIDFLNDLDRASKASPIFDVINIACVGVGFVPSTICVAVSTAVGTVNSAAQEMQIRYRTNRFLDGINESMFKPRGLYVMIMTYKPDMSDEAILQADMSDPTSLSLQKRLDKDSNKFKQRLSRLRISSGTVTNDAQIPEPAPLIYPALDRALLTNGNTNTDTTSPTSTTSPSTSLQTQPQSQSTLTKTSTTIQDYLDRRAQANFSHTYPTSTLTTTYNLTQPKFVNRFADPNHPVNSGSIFGLLSGGTFDPIASGRIRRAERRAKKNNELPLTDGEKHDAYMGRKVRGAITGTPSKDIPLGLGRLFKRDVLYLVVVNLPRVEDVQRVRDQLERD